MEKEMAKTRAKKIKSSLLGITLGAAFAMNPIALATCKISQENAFSFYCPGQDVTLTFYGDQVIDVRGQDIGFGTLHRQTIAPTYREETVVAGLSIYTNPQPASPILSTTFLEHESHSGELSNPGKSIIGKKCSISSN